MSYLEGVLKGIKPLPDITVSEWADKYRFLTTKSSAEPGQWRTSRTPYLKEIMDVMSPNELALFPKTKQSNQKTLETFRQMGAVVEDSVIIFPKTLKRKFQAFLLGCEPTAIQTITLG